MDPVCSFLHNIATLFTTAEVSEKQGTENLPHLSYERGWNHHCNCMVKRKGRNWIETWADCINLCVAAQTAYVLGCCHLITQTLAPPSCCAPLTAFAPFASFHSCCCCWLQASSSSSSSPPGSSSQSPAPSPASQSSAITRVCSPSGDLMTIISLQHFNKSLNPRRFQCPKHDVVDLPSPGI